MTDNMFGWQLGEDRILTLVMDDPTQATNTMTQRCFDDFSATIERLQAEIDTYDGIILTSGKDTFHAGGDLQHLRDSGPDDVEAISAELDAHKRCFRALETLGKPVVAAINGTALGGGFEYALATHHRVALDKAGSLLGLPEVTFGVLPGAGGTTRVVRMIGVADAVINVIGQGQRMTPAQALHVGIIDEVAATEDEMLTKAKEWIKANPAAKQPWDRPGYKIPGGTPTTGPLAANLPAFPANVRKSLKGSPMPAPIAVLATAVEGAMVDIDTAFAIETRYCANLICGQISTNLIKGTFFDLTAVNKGTARPAAIAPQVPTKVAVLGAGMMGAAIAYVTARAGIDVVLRDVSLDAAERGKDYSRSLLEKELQRAKITEIERDEILGRILATGDVADVKGADLVVEAVFEDLELKKEVFAEVEPHLAADALIATNTSALPLGEMAGVVTRPADFIGLHFFSPVDKMPLVEIVVGDSTGDEAVARAFDFARAIRKTPIAVKDVYAFYANRVIAQYFDQALAMVGEGAHPASVEQAATQAGFPVGALALLDEINLRTTLKIQIGAQAAAESSGEQYIETAGTPIMARMVEEFDRPGRLAGRGFYEYDPSTGARLGLWPQLIETYHRPDNDMPFGDMLERLLFAAALEGARCLEAGIVGTVEEANVGSIYGIGYPAWTGGVLQFINQYADGPGGFVRRARDLQRRYGDRFRVPVGLEALAAAGRHYGSHRRTCTDRRTQAHHTPT